MTNIVCPHCGSTNRAPEDRSPLEARCGKCGEPLFTPTPPDVSGQNLDRQIQRSSLPVLVDVWAPWCGPCRVMGPQFEAAAQEAQPALRFVKLNSDENQDMSARLGIRGIPTMLLFQDGKEVGRVSGAMSSRDILSWARGQLAAH